MPQARRSLAYRILAPIIAFGTVLSLATVAFVYFAVSEFVQQQATNDLRWRAFGVHQLIDSNLDELQRAGKTGDETAVRQRKVNALMAIEDFARVNELNVTVRDLAESRSIEIGSRTNTSGELRRYSHTFSFEPWRWDVTLTLDDRAYQGVFNRLMWGAGISAFAFIAIVTGLMFYLAELVGKPIRKIVRDLKQNQPPQYEGIAEFEYLANNIATMMKAIREQSELLEATFDDMEEGLCVFDSQLRCLARNTKFLQLYGLNESGSEVKAEITEVLQQVLAEQRDTLVKGTREHIALEHVRPNGRIIQLHFNPMGAGRYVSTHEDITDRVHAEQAVRELNETLERRVSERTEELARANQELEAFSYSVSHDLRAPLRAISGFASMVAENEGNAISEDGKDLLNRVTRNAVRMGQLIDDILAFARISRMEVVPREVDITDLARTTVAELREPYPNAEITIDPMPSVLGSEPMLRQVYANLIGNALKFSGKCGRPRVAIGSTEFDGKPIFFVKDNGVGFDMAHAEKLFGVFQRMHTDKDFPGTGVGLAIVKRVVERHGGRVWVEAAPGLGATFYFTLGSPADTGS